MAEDFTNKRSHKRIFDSFLVRYTVTSPFTVHIRIGQKNIEAVATDISEGGMGLVTNYEIPANTRLELKFNIINDAATLKEEEFNTFELEGDVRYSLVIDKGFRLGISFRNLPEKDRNFISRYVQTNSLRKSVDPSA